MTCRDVEKQMGLFLDGELDGRAMRAVALHTTRCLGCEAALQRFERVQDLVADTFADAVGDVDFASFWPGVEARAQRPAPSLRPGPVALGSVARLVGARSLIAVAATLAAVWLAAGLWRGGVAPVEQPARANNQARIDSLASEAASVALLFEPASNTTVIWVVDDGGTR
jgi:anti-sigma factor RsiW